jgi:hypothetical protein
MIVLTKTDEAFMINDMEPIPIKLAELDNTPC